MMPRFHIVTDSSAQIGGLLDAQQASVMVIPNRIIQQSKVVLDNRALSADELASLLVKRSHPLIVEPPRAEDYVQAFQQAAKHADGLLCITPSRHITQHWERAQVAVSMVSGLCPIHVFDCATFSAAQTELVLRAVEFLPQVHHLDELQRTLRGQIDKTYLMLYVERVEYMLRGQILAPQHTFFSAMLNLRPLLAIEAGYLRPIEKARSRTQALDRLFEFASEFSDATRIMILYDRESQESAERLKERLDGEIQGQIDIFVYNPALAAFVGVGGLGIAVFDSETQ